MRWAEPRLIRIKKNFDFPSTTSKRLEREGGGEFWSVGWRVAEWIENNCMLTTAQFAGKPFVLLNWQKRWLDECFEVVPKDDIPSSGRYTPKSDVEWRLKYRWVMLGIPKKNGKSELIAALSLFFLLGTDENDPRIFVAASTEEQANMVFTPTKFMASHSPSITQLVTVKQRLVESLGTRGGFIKRLAAVAGANDGQNVYVALIDEFHEWHLQSGRDTFNVITNGTVMREEPMVIMITTAGYDEDTSCYEWYEMGCDVREGAKDDDTFHFTWFEAPEDMDYKTRDFIECCNPSFGQVMHWEFYEDQVKRKTENVYRRYFGNQWTDAEEIWEAAQHWDKLTDKDVALDPDTRTYVGIDIGRKTDQSAVVALQLFERPDGMYEARVKQWIWRNPYGIRDSRRADWRMNIFDVDKKLRELLDEYPVASGWDEEEELRISGPVFAYDPHMYGSHADRLVDDGLNMQEVPQTDNQMVPASQHLFEWIVTNRVRHDGDPTARRHIRTVIAKEKERGWRISKPTGRNKHVDFAIALAMALHVAIANEFADNIGPITIW